MAILFLKQVLKPVDESLGNRAEVFELVYGFLEILMESGANWFTWLSGG